MQFTLISVKLALLFWIQECDSQFSPNFTQEELRNKWEIQNKYYNDSYGCKKWPFIMDVVNDSPAGALFPSTYLIWKCSGYCVNGVSHPMSIDGIEPASEEGHSRVRQEQPIVESCKAIHSRKIYPVFKFENYADDGGSTSYKRFEFIEDVSCACRP